MRTLLVVVSLLLVVVFVPLATLGATAPRPAGTAAMPPGVLMQVTNASPGEVMLHVDGQFAGVLAVNETLVVPAYPGHRFLAWQWVATGQRGSATVEVSNEPTWQFVIR